MENSICPDVQGTDDDAILDSTSRCLAHLKASRNLLQIILAAAQLLESPFIGNKHLLIKQIVENARSMECHFTDVLVLIDTERFDSAPR